MLQVLVASGGVFVQWLYSAVVRVPIWVPIWSPSLQIFHVLDLSVRVSIQGVATSRCLLVEVSLLREGSLFLQLLDVWVDYRVPLSGATSLVMALLRVITFPLLLRFTKMKEYGCFARSQNLY